MYKKQFTSNCITILNVRRAERP